MNNELKMEDLDSVSGGSPGDVTKFTITKIETPKGTLTLINGTGSDGVPINGGTWVPK